MGRMTNAVRFKSCSHPQTSGMSFHDSFINIMTVLKLWNPKSSWWKPSLDHDVSDDGNIQVLNGRVHRNLRKSFLKGQTGVAQEIIDMLENYKLQADVTWDFLFYHNSSTILEQDWQKLWNLHPWIFQSLSGHGPEKLPWAEDGTMDPQNPL